MSTARLRYQWQVVKYHAISFKYDLFIMFIDFKSIFGAQDNKVPPCHFASYLVNSSWIELKTKQKTTTKKQTLKSC